MSDEKKPDKLFFDEKTGIVHGHDCPRTKKEFGEASEGKCPVEKFVHDLRSYQRDSVAALAGDVLQAGDHRCADGPAQVASRAYREGHDRIFGTKPPVGQA